MPIFKVTAGDLFLPRRGDTFHGRDIFAPLAAHLACGLPLDRLGPKLEGSGIKHLALPEVSGSQGTLSGFVVHIDHFGNLMTNIDRQTVSSFCRQDFNLITIKIRDFVIRGINRSYSTGHTPGPVAEVVTFFLLTSCPWTLNSGLLLLFS